MKRYITIKQCALAIFALTFIPHPAYGRDDDQKNAKEEKAKEEKEREERKSKREAVQKAMKAKDLNHDGSLSKEEYIAGEPNAEEAAKKFDQFNKNGDRFLSKSELAESLDM